MADQGIKEDIVQFILPKINRKKDAMAVMAALIIRVYKGGKGI